MSEGAKPIPIDTLSVEELESIVESVAAECRKYEQATQQLILAINTYTDVRGAVDSLVNSGPEQPLMVPLTDSLYVRGKLDADEGAPKLLVDIGTGYYAEKSIDDTRDFVTRKQEFVKLQLQDIDAKLQDSRKSLQKLQFVLQEKKQASAQ